MLVDIGGNTWIEAGHVVSVGLTKDFIDTDKDGDDQTAVEMSDGAYYYTDESVAEVGKRIRKTQLEMLAVGIS